MAITRLGPNSVNLTSAVTGTLPTANGGTGATSFTKGKVLQFVDQEEQTAFTTNSSSAVDSGINVSITPTATNSKILLTTNFVCRTAGNTYCSFYVYRQINGGGYSELDRLETGWHYYINETISTTYFGKKVDTTHNTTNQIDYKIYCHVQGGGGNMSILIDNAGNLGNFSAMEIEA
tara:strand:+ start:518 stop:1048 length:531 start_codon:yes stop_codon:yes gene_type:complete